MHQLSPSVFDIDWLLRADSARVHFPIPPVRPWERLDLPIAPETGQGFIERLQVVNGPLLMRSRYRLRSAERTSRIALGSLHIELSETILLFQSVRGGRVWHRQSEPPTELIYQSGYDMFRRGQAFHIELLVDSPADTEMVGLGIVETLLIRLLDATLAERLIDRLDLNPAPAARVWAMPNAVSEPLRAALSNQLQGPLQQLFAQAKALEYLCGLAAHIELPSSPEPCPHSRSRDRARALHEYLIHLEGKLPTLDALGNRFGLSARRLNEAFTREYGQPIYAFISDWRLNEAHQAIRDSSVPLKQLAARLGYAHVNHFNNAFKRRFGYPPGSLRRNRRRDDEAWDRPADDTRESFSIEYAQVLEISPMAHRSSEG